MQNVLLMMHASTTHPDELLLLPELFEELLPEPLEEELELPETGDVLDGAMTPGGVCQPLNVDTLLTGKRFRVIPKGVATRSITTTGDLRADADSRQRLMLLPCEGQA